MSHLTWSLYVRDPDLQRQGQIENFALFEAVLRFNDVGTWVLEMDGRHQFAESLTRPRWGVILYRGSTVVMSGTVREYKHSVTDARRITVAGNDDNVWLKRRVVSPVPSASSPPYSAAEHDVRTGTTSTILRQYVDVNLGPSAVTVRRLAGLELGADTLVGPSVTGRGRWQDALALLQELAAAGNIGFRVAQVGSALQFQAYQTLDRSADVKFSPDLGNLLAYEYKVTAPEATYVYVLGGGEGTARTVVERSDPQAIAIWGRIEKTIDRRDTTDVAELAQAGDEALLEAAQQTHLSITPVDTDRLAFHTHYGLGDDVTVHLDDLDTVVQDRVHQVTIRLSAEAQRVTPSVGTGRINEPGLLNAWRLIDRRVADLERRR